MPSRLGSALVLVQLAIVVGCGRIDYRAQPSTDAATVDADAADAATVDADAADAAPPDAAPPDAAPPDAGELGTFAPPTPLAGIDGAFRADDPTLTGDRLELYFNARDDIYVSRRSSTDQPWEPGAVVPELSSAGGESSPEISPDGLTIYFSRDDGTGSSYDIFVSTRALRSDLWGAPVRVTEVSTTAFETNPAATGDGTRLVFSRGASGGSRDLYEAARDSPSDRFGEPVPLVELASASNDGSPMLALGDTSIVFYSNRPDGMGDALYIATRATPASAFGAPMRLTELDTSGSEVDPWISEDGRHLVFSRDGVLQETTR